MRGEHCVAGASILSAIAVILLVFANIGQVGSGALVNSIYFAEVNVEAYGNALKNVSKSAPAGLYDTKATTPLGSSKGLRQYYRYGIYNACGYQKGGDGICNSTTFGYPMDPFMQIRTDTPSDFKKQWTDIIPASTFKDSDYNHGMSRAAGLLVFVGSCFAVIALILGVIKARIFFFGAAVSAGISALLLMVGGALWTALIAKDAWIKAVKVEKGANLGIITTAGPSLYLVWVAFAMVTLSIAPYVIACCTFRRN